MGSRGHHGALFPALLASLLVAVLLAPAAPAQGPEGEPIYKTRGGGQGFELYADGTLIIGGDVVGSCEALVREARPKPVEPDREFLRQTEACEDAGFPVPGSGSLPKTGGPPVLTALAVLIAGGAILSLGVRR